MKEEWKKVKLGEVCLITSSKRFHLSERTTSGIPFYCTKEILLKLKGEENFECDYIAEKFYDEIKSKYGVPETGDLLLTTRGTVGFPYLYKATDKFYFADGNLSWFKNFSDRIDSHFLYYWFLSPEGKHEVDSIAKGTAQKAVPITGLGTIGINLPSLPTQQKIASILSAYDDLIENNRKQIKLLEEAAQKLYKEWFVKLNFPDHENTKIVDGIPEGWKKVTLASLGIFRRGKVITRSKAGNGNIPVIAGGIEPAYYTDEANTLCPVITISASGNAGFVRLYNCKVWASDCSYLDYSSTEYLYFIYTYLKLNQAYLYSLQKGACQQHVSANVINELELLVSSNEIIDRFEKLVTPIYQKIKNLQDQVYQLQSARDKLLPKLMNGELEV